MDILPGYYIYSGLIPLAQLYLIGQKIDRLPTQTDQIGRGRQWLEPGNEASRIRPTTLTQAVTSRQYNYGHWQFRWPLQGLSPNMVGYIQGTLLDGGWTADATIQTFNRASGGWEAYWAVANLGDFKDAELVAGGYSNLMLEFEAAEYAPNGPDLRPYSLYSKTTNIIPADTITIDMAARNTGDFVTMYPIYVTYNIPTGFLFVSVTGGTYTIEYYYSGSYHSTPPGDLSTLVGIRGTYNNTIAPGVIGFTMTVTLQAVAPGASTPSVITTTTLADTNPGNDSETTTLTIRASGFDTGFSSGFGS